MSRRSRNCVQAVVTRTPPRTAIPPPTTLYQWREGMSCRRFNQSPNSAACECRWSRRWLQRGACNASAASALDTRSENADTPPGASRVGAPTSPVGALPRGRSLSAVAAGVTTPRNIAAVLSGKGRRRPLQRKRPCVSERAPPQATPPLRKLSGQGPLPSR